MLAGYASESPLFRISSVCAQQRVLIQHFHPHGIGLGYFRSQRGGGRNYHSDRLQYYKVFIKNQ